MPSMPRLTPGEGIPAYGDTGGGGGGGTAGAVPGAEAKPKLLEVKSPMVGTFYQCAGARCEAVRVGWESC